MLWGVSPTGECCCPAGSSRRQARIGQAIGATTHCGGSGPGKHPWVVGKNGYLHGAAEADVSQAAAVEKWGPVTGSRRWAVTLNDVVVIDLDGSAAELAFARIARHLPLSKIMGAARTPRGWHIYVDAPGWNQRALNHYMRAWLGDWHGTDRTKITRRGLLLDVRTGPNRYVVWPDGSGEPARRWAQVWELTSLLRFRGYRMQPGRQITDGSAAPWNLSMTPEVVDKITKLGQYLPRPDGVTSSGDVQGGIPYATRELYRWCDKLAAMPPDSGRNSMLNQVSFYAGARAVHAGMPEATVRGKLERAALASGLTQAETTMTINSGLGSGLASLATPARSPK